jgi:segregation and condensation protein A
MQVKSVPWWRKALDFALSGIRSGFGLFSKAEKNKDEIEPETAAGHEEIREEEATLTDHFPEQDSIVEAVSTLTAAAEMAIAFDAETVAEPEAAPQDAPVAASRPDVESQPEEMVPELEAQSQPEEALISEPEAELQPQEVQIPEVGLKTEEAKNSEPEFESQPEETIVQESEAADEAVVAEPEASTETEIASEPEIEPETVPVQNEQGPVLLVDEPATAATLDEPIADEALATTAIEETLEPPEIAIQPEVEAAPDLVLVVNAPADEPIPQPEAEAAVEAETPVVVEFENVAGSLEAEPVQEHEPLIQTDAEMAIQPADEETSQEDQLSKDEEPTALEDAPAQQESVMPEVAAPEPEVAGLIEIISKPIETPAEPIVETVSANDDQATTIEEAPEATEPQELIEANTDSKVDAEVASIEPRPLSEVQDEFVVPSANATPEQIEEQQVSFENVKIDELAPQAESAISEDSAPSHVPNESIEPVTDEAVAESPVEVAEVLVDKAAAQLRDQTTDQGTEIDQVIAEPMESNHPNPEPGAEPEQTASNTAPIPPEESANTAPETSAPEPTADAPSANDEPEAPTSVAPAAQHPSKPFIKLESREGEANASPFSVIVSQVYDGPLDLLLDLIRKQDIDIYDIPIARITAQFLAYVDQLKATDVDVAGEFIYTASLLIHIKSKMLLPRAPSGPDDAAEDPRRELVERLLEHERFKNAAQMLQQKQMLEAATWTNPGMREFKEDAGAEAEIAADTTDLVRVFQDILERIRNRPVLNVEEDTVTVGQMIQFLSRRLTMEDKPIALRKLLSHSRSERALIAMFLALLELVRLQAILLRQDRAFSEIFIKKHSNFENAMTETQDSWK